MVNTSQLDHIDTNLAQCSTLYVASGMGNICPETKITNENPNCYLEFDIKNLR